MQLNDFACKICGNTQANAFLKIREMMFGLREEFEYVACKKCGCLQIKEIPADMAKYYPPQYRSLIAPNGAAQIKRDNMLVRSLRHARTLYALKQESSLGRVLLKFKPLEYQWPEYLEWLKKCKATFDSKILDVGCGAGKFLLELSCYGFNNLTGIDPYINSDIAYDNGVKILKKELTDEEGLFDVIMFHHSFEHMDEPQRVLETAGKSLSASGYILIRIPTVSSYAWKEYGVNWAQIDAPRHFFLYSLENIEMLTERARLTVREITFDSTDFQFWGSEQYRRDIPLLDERSYLMNKTNSIFSDVDIKSFQEKAAQLNRLRQGDQICVYLTKK
jgi:SAM-dependent methyltransferase